MKSSARVCMLLLTLLVASAAHGAGYAVWEMGIRSSGMGGVTAASANDPSAIFYNPAGLIGLPGQQLNLSLTSIIPRTEFAGVGPDPGYGVTERLDDPMFILPQIYYTREMSKKLSLGLGFYTPFGLLIEWADGDNYSGRHIAKYTDLKTFFFTPTIAYRASDRLRLGLGLNIVRGEVELRQHVFMNLPNETELGEAVITGEANTAFGVTVGVLLDLDEKTHLGLVYRSGMDLDFEGEAEFTALYEGAPLPEDGDAFTMVPLPTQYTLGLARQFSEKLMVEVNMMRIEWSAFEELVLETPGGTKVIEENYEDTMQFRLGVEYDYSEALILRTGFIMDESPQPLEGTGPVLPDADRTGFSLGGTWFNGNWDLEFYHLFLFAEEREVRNHFDNYNGDYNTYINLTGVGFTYHF